MNTYYMWAVSKAKVTEATIHALTPQQAYGHFLDELKLDGLTEADIIAKGACEVDESDEHCAEVRTVPVDQLYNDSH